MKSTLTLAALLVLTLTPAAPAADLYVAPKGDDKNPGTQSQPFASLDAARNAIRELKSQGPLKEPVTVHIADGAYPLTHPLILLPEDSGTARGSHHLRAQPSARPVFNGGRKSRAGSPAPTASGQPPIPEVAAGHWYFEQLFVNGQRATRARTPNKFYYFIQDLSEEIVEKGQGRVRPQSPPDRSR